MTVIRFLIMLPPALFTPRPLFFKNINILMMLGLTITFAAIVYPRGISEISARTSSILALLEPAFRIFFDITILKNPVYISTLLGCGLILTVAYVVIRRDLSK